VVSLESPLPPIIQRGLGDRANEKRKNAALEIEALVKSLQEAQNFGMVHSVIGVLSKDFCTSMNANYRKGGLVGLAATAIGLMQYSRDFLGVLLPPILHCFDDPEARVRYYACESLYNVAKVSRQAILPSFNQIFEGLTKLYADVDVDVKNGADLLCRLVKDIVTEADSFSVDSFLPLLQSYIRRTNPYIRQLIVGWITLLDSIPDMNMLNYLPDFLDGLFNMLSDSNREIRQAADSALADFLREVTASTVMDFGPMISILVLQCQCRERLNRLTAITWIAELIHHPHSGGDALLPYHSDVLGAVLFCISDGERDIRSVAERTNDDLLSLVRETSAAFELRPLLDTLTNELLVKEDVPTKMAALAWINMLMEKRKKDMNEFTEPLLPVLLRTLSDPSDRVVLLDLQVLSRISLAHRDELGFVEEAKETQFQLVLNAILNLFAQDRQLLETRGSLIVRKLCVLLNAKAVYIRLADTLSSFEGQADDKTLEFISTMVQTLNLILLTASELHELRTTLAGSFQRQWRSRGDEAGQIFANIFHCWCHNPVATFSLCLLAQAYDLSFALVKRFAEMEDVSVGFLMQIDNLVHLLESPIFVHLRLQLLDVEAPYHAPLLKSIYGILMCLPQGDAFRVLNERLTTVCNLRDTLGFEASDNEASDTCSVSKLGLDMGRLLDRYDAVVAQHLRAARPSPPDGHLAGENGGGPSGKSSASPSIPSNDNDSTLRPSTVKSRLLAVRAKQEASFTSGARRPYNKIPES
jgi:vacuole morphology and inheritance protein 14